MNPQHVQDCITAVKEDKSIAQPWRNYAMKAGMEMIAFIEKGQRATNLTPPAGTNLSGDPTVCVCVPGLRNSSCRAAVHVA